MLKELYQAIRKDAEVKEVTIDNRIYTTDSIYPVKEPYPEAIELSTLTSLVDYIKTNIDKLDLDKLIINIEGPRRVSLLSNLVGSFEQRKKYISVVANNPRIEYGQYLDNESFNIMLQAKFVDNTDIYPSDKSKVLFYCSKVQELVGNNVDDDGISQQVTVKQGIVSLTTGTLPNPVTLRPFRTFSEIEQPASPFIFRAQKGQQFAIFEADGGAWENEAMLKIKEFLTKNLATQIAILA